MITTTYTEKHNTYGGLIYNYDYEESYAHTLSEIAERIFNDRKFDERCRKNLDTAKKKFKTS